MIRPILTHACVSWVGGLSKLYLTKKLVKVQRLACVMTSSAFPSTPTGALEVLLNVTPINEFILAEAVRGSVRISRAGLWPSKFSNSIKNKNHEDVCNKVRRDLPLLQMPSDTIQKHKVFKRNFECIINERDKAENLESVPEQNTIKVFTDGSKMNGRVGAGYYIELPDNSRTEEAVFYLGRHSTVFQAEVFAILKVAEKLLTEKLQNENISILVDSQAAIKALEASIVTSCTVLEAIKSLNNLGCQNRIFVTWIPGHSGIHGNEKVDKLAKAGSTLQMQGPEPFITVPHASLVSELKNWTTERWKSTWNKRKDCLRTKENVGWPSPRLCQRLLNLNRTQLNNVLQVLTGHCNLQKHKKTIGCTKSSLCTKCGCGDETPNHHVGSCTHYKDIRTKYLGDETTTIRSVVDKYNITKLATYLKKAGRLSEYDH